MKKLLIACLLSFGTIAGWAQNEEFNDIRIAANPEMICGEPIIASGYYAPGDLSSPEAEHHQWSLTRCDQDGNLLEDPIFTGEMPGAPEENFQFPDLENLQCDQFYSIGLTVVDMAGAQYSTALVVSVNSASCISGGTQYYTRGPGESVAMTTQTLSLASGIYYYTLSSAGNQSVVNNLTVAVNYTSVWPSSGSNTYWFSANNNTPFGISLMLSPAAPVCANQTFTLKFYNYLGQQVCQYSISVTCNKPVKQTITNMPAGAYYGIYYKGDDNQIHRMYWAGNGWNYQAITPWGGYPAGVDGWLNVDNPTNKIFYKGTDNKLYNLMLLNTGHLTGAISSVANVKSDLQYRNNECVYIGTDNLIHRVYWANNTWNYQAITPAGGWGGVTAAGGLTLAPSWGSKNVFFRDQNNVIRNLFLYNNTWMMMAVTTPANGTMYSNGEMVFDEGQARIYFRGTDNNIHNVTYNTGTGQWGYFPMTSVNGNITVMNTITHYPGENRVIFKGPDDRVYNVWQQSNGQWRIDWLNGYYNNVRGDLVTTGNNVFYVSKSKYIGNYYFPGSGIWPSGPLMPSGPFNAIGCSTYYRLGDDTEEAESTSPELTFSNDAFNVYPNPSNGNFQLQLVAPSDNARAELFNVLGERIDEFTFSGEIYNYTPDQPLKSGIYMMIINSNGSKYSKKIIID